MQFDADFFVIGAGSGGVRAARVAAGHGARTIVAEESRVGGTCVIRGCVPKKIYVYASRFADEFVDARSFGWNVGETTFDWNRLVAAKEKEITRLSATYRANLESSGATLLEKRATVVGPQRVRLQSGKEYSVRHILVAVGARPALIGGVDGIEHMITSDQVFDLPRFPHRLLIVGGGYIAVEFASLFQRLGAQVAQVMRAPNVLRGFDLDMRNGMRDSLSRAGVQLRFNCLPVRIEKQADDMLAATLSDGSVIKADQVLMATGRLPNTEGLGLEEAGVKLSPHGAIKVDHNLTSAVPTVHAVGDVTHRVNLTPVAIREGHTLADRLFGSADKPIRYETIASVVFGTPELGVVGLTEAEAIERFSIVEVFATDFRPMKATISGRADRILFKLVVDGVTKRLVGAHLLAPEAGEMIQLVAVAMNAGATKDDFDATMAVHPTMAEELVTMRFPTARFENGVRVK